MERIMSVEEKIRRAEEIYERRKQGNTKNVATMSVNNKKDIKLLKKMLIQLLICTVIYIVVYMINNNDYIFSDDFINKANEILSYDTNFMEIYENIKNQINGIMNQSENNDNSGEGIGGAEETTQNNEFSENQQEENEEKDNNLDSLSQAEQDILNIKNTTTFIKPVEGTISSRFGQRDSENGTVPKNHTGTDIAANLGTKIVSSTDGEVVLSSEEGDYGKHLKIQIGEVSIIYAHCNNLYVKQGDKVTQGQEIAEVGSTGNSTGPHLHFEIRISERTVDPESILEL